MASSPQGMTTIAATVRFTSTRYSCGESGPEPTALAALGAAAPWAAEDLVRGAMSGSWLLTVTT